jgi:hypothetical protein
VKVGNRQAPQQQTETPPKKVGFLRLRKRYQQRRSNIWVPESRRNALVRVAIEE